MHAGQHVTLTREGLPSDVFPRQKQALCLSERAKGTLVSGPRLIQRHPQHGTGWLLPSTPSHQVRTDTAGCRRLPAAPWGSTVPLEFSRSSRNWSLIDKSPRHHHEPPGSAAAATTRTAPRPPRTFVQPVAEAVVNHTFLASGDHADGLLPDVRAVVDIVLKDKYLIGKRKKTHINQGSGYRVFLKAQTGHLVGIFLVHLFDRTSLKIPWG